MIVEIQMLIFASILGLVQLLAAAHLSTMQRGLKWNLSSRESSRPPLTGMAGRVDRSYRNFMETFPIFIVAIFAVLFLQKGTSLSYWGSQLYFYSRVLYFFVYAAGITGLRTLIWGASLIGLVMVLCSLL
ncbi:hypothetical protein AZI86_03550 [Bdellovibrio bacteriovorus]|uniref:MAPEG family protein n=1 Tax=Bdellovibrio bacteriovorus TaxID=959 RepID=A0A150WPC4_BDEBC|nr:MAPEG family protein [Bdellovibrio bacteriovorus]KYG66149.1 hypothetical protein AZI86_03550 [Bdellovibrio bacteriovorus]